jgi:threonine dehydrogenase-like Zn-dependent dehydrogenase
MCTGHHCALKGGVGPGAGAVVIIGDGAVGLCAVIAAKRLGAEQIILMGSHEDRTTLGREFGATDVIAERGEDGIARLRDLTRDGARVALECVGSLQALETAFGAVRDGGVISRAGVPQYTEGPIGMDMLMRNITLTGGATPARAYIEEFMPDVLNGRIEPGRVFDQTLGLEDVPDGYRAMAAREALKVLIKP